MVTASPHNDIYTESTELSTADEEASGAMLVAPDGSQVALSQDTYTLFQRILQQFRLGRSIQLVTYEQELTTQQTADILNVSRQYLVRLLENNELPFHRVGTHRRVSLKDVLDYRKRRSESQRKSLARLTQASQEMGDYDD